MPKIIVLIMGFDSEKSFVMAERLKQLREEKGLSHDKLSKALFDQYGVKISSDSLINYEVADPYHTKAFKNQGMRVEYLRCLADFYGVSVDYILGNIKDPCRVPSAIDELGLSESVVKWFRCNLTRPSNPQEYVAGINEVLSNQSIQKLIYSLWEYEESVKAREIYSTILYESHGNPDIRKEKIRAVIKANVYSEFINRCLIGNDFMDHFDVCQFPTVASFLQEAVVADFSEVYASRLSREFTFILRDIEAKAVNDYLTAKLKSAYTSSFGE